MTDLGQNPPGAPLPQLDGADPADLVQRVTAVMFEVVDEVAPVIARQIIKRVPELGPLEDETAFEATRKSAAANMYEFLCVTRAGLGAPGVIETTPEALEHLRFVQRRGVGMQAVMRYWHIALAMFEPLMLHELARVVPDQNTAQLLVAPIRQFMYTYVDQTTRRLAAEFGTDREGWVGDMADPIWHDPDSVQEINRFIEQLAAKEHAQTKIGAAARAYTEAALQRFCAAMGAAAQDERLSSVLARAHSTVRIELADDPELSVTLLLDRNPIEVVQTDEAAEVEISIVSADLARLYSPDFHLAMAISRGRVGYTGPVRKFLRVTPVVRHASLPQLVGDDALAVAR
jgi:hypothetical protein